MSLLPNELNLGIRLYPTPPVRVVLVIKLTNHQMRQTQKDMCYIYFLDIVS